MIRVLVFDNQPIVGKGLDALCRAEPDIEVVGHALSLSEAEDHVARLAPAVLLIDPGMEVGGLDAMARLRRTHKSTPIVVFTRLDQEAFVVQALRLGVRAYIMKSDSTDLLFSAIRLAVYGRRTISPHIQDRFTMGPDGRIDEAHFKTRMSSLTQRQLETVNGLAHGLTVKEVAAFLRISVNTVDNHRSHAMKKLGVRNRTGLVRVCYEEGLLAAPPLSGAIGRAAQASRGEVHEGPASLVSAVAEGEKPSVPEGSSEPLEQIDR